MDDLQLSTRSFNRILKVERNIVDLARKQTIELPHVAEAIFLRCLDKPLIPNSVNTHHKNYRSR